MKKKTLNTFRFPKSKYIKIPLQKHEVVTKTERRQHQYRWKFLRLRKEYKDDYAGLINEAASSIKTCIKATKGSRNYEAANSRLLHMAKEFCIEWRISEPIDPQEEDLPDDVFFYSIGLISAYYFKSDDVCATPHPGSAFRKSTNAFQSYIDKINELGVPTSILQINIDLKAQKVTKIDLRKILTEAQKEANIKNKGAGKIEYHELDEALSAYDLHMQGLNLTEIARHMITSRNPSGRTKDSKKMVERAKALIAIAPFIPF